VLIYNALQKITPLTQAAFDDGRDSGLYQYTDANSANPDDVVLSALEAATLLDRSSAEYLSTKRSDITDTVENWIAEDNPITASDINEYVEPKFWVRYTGGSRAASYLNKTASQGDSFDDRDINAIQRALQEHSEPVDGSIPTKVFTIHASKGNEAENVVVYDGITKRIQQGIDTDAAEYNNEYRTWYVAFTRASSNLIVLKDAFDFTKPFLPSGRKLKQQALHGYDKAEEDSDSGRFDE
jgi:DNA helicase-2/ATP-dependent DNA helicase PcrA